MKRFIVVIVSAIVSLFLVGCESSIEDVQREAEFTAICVDGGGHIWYNGWGEINCSFEKEK